MIGPLLAMSVFLGVCMLVLILLTARTRGQGLRDGWKMMQVDRVYRLYYLAIAVFVVAEIGLWFSALSWRGTASMGCNLLIMVCIALAVGHRNKFSSENLRAKP